MLECFGYDFFGRSEKIIIERELRLLPNTLTHFGLSSSPILTKNKLLWIPTRAVLAPSSSYHP